MSLAAPTAPRTDLSEAQNALGALLAARGLVDAKTLDRAFRVAEESGQRFDAVLTQLGLVSDKALAATLGELLALPLAPAARYPAAPLLAERLRPKFLRRARLMPVAMEEGRLVLAMADPFDRFAVEAVASATELDVAVEVAVPAELEAAFDRLYSEAGGEARQGDRDIETVPGHADESDAERLKDLASEAPVIRLVNNIIARAVQNMASDIHIEPQEDRLRVRLRYDGVLHDEEAPPKRMAAAIVSRIKIMSELDIAERRLPQDGRLQLAVRGQEVDFRVSTMPSLHGETVVLRVLDRAAVEFSFAKLGLAPSITRRLQDLLELQNGIVLVTGPTGSGKTTTLYTGLLGLNSEARKIVTIEDPIEYELAGITQTQVKPQIGLDFAALLRTIMRQNPNVIMVGEIRDMETAEIAARASLTGHLVLSTLHTNSAAASITRLRDMGLEDYLISAVVRGVLAQRLVRRLCPHCMKAEPAPESVIERFGLRAHVPEGPVTLYHPVGCPECRQTGYRGRQAITELLVPDDKIKQLIFARADHTQIEVAAVAAGMRTLMDAGIDAALAGVTSLEEVDRTIRAEA
jgi:general secretion pathway protein E